jgi:signal recognition particle GTPase
MKTRITSLLQQLSVDESLSVNQVEVIYSNISKALSSITKADVEYEEVEEMYEEIIDSTDNTYADKHHTTMLELADRLVELKRLFR